MLVWNKIFRVPSSMKDDPKPPNSPPFLELNTERPVLLIGFLGGLLALTAGIMFFSIILNMCIIITIYIFAGNVVLCSNKSVISLIYYDFSLLIGYLNSVCLLLWDRSVTHATGLVTKTANNLVKDSILKFLVNGLQILCFLSGATASSFMVGAHRTFMGGRQYR